MTKILYVGMDVHPETIAVALAEQDGEVRSHGVIPNRVESIRKLSGKLVGKLGPAKRLRVCYEAGPTGYALYWQLAALGVACELIAPSLIPRKPGERIKTDRRDAEKLARCHRAGELTGSASSCCGMRNGRPRAPRPGRRITSNGRMRRCASSSRRREAELTSLGRSSRSGALPRGKVAALSQKGPRASPRATFARCRLPRKGRTDEDSGRTC